MKNSKMLMVAITTTCGAVLLAGCPKTEETVVVQPEEKVIEKTTIKEAPKKTVIVKQPQKAAPKTNVKTEVTVNIKPTPTAKPATTPTPSATPKLKAIGTPRPVATATAKPKVTPRPTPKATAKPVAKATATPRPIAKTDSKNLVVRAEVVSTSKVPDPKTVPYKESLVFTKYKVLSVQSGQYKEKEILVAQWGMKDKKILPAGRIRVGQVQTLSLEPLSKHSELESVMRNDDTNEFELDPYFAK